MIPLSKIQKTASDADEATSLFMKNQKPAGQDEVQQYTDLPFEAAAWLAAYDHYLPKMFISHYMQGTGNTLTLTANQMNDLLATTDIMNSSDFKDILEAAGQIQAKRAGPVVYRQIKFSGPAGAPIKATLGNFTANYSGKLEYLNGHGKFTGHVSYYDYWNFDPKLLGESNRPISAELKVWIAGAFMRGKPYLINSVWIPYNQNI